MEFEHRKQFGFKKYLKYLKAYGYEEGSKLYRMMKNDISEVFIPNIKNPIALRKDTSDLPTFYQVFVRKEYNIDYPFVPKVIIDGGANIGLFSIYMKQKFPEAMIIAIEPDKENMEMMKKNLAPYTYIEFEEKGIWSHNTKLNAYDKYNNGKWAIIVEENEEGQIDGVSIDSLKQKYQIKEIDLLKLDIETSEKEVFTNNYAAWLPFCKMIIIEFHDRYLEGCTEAFYNALKKVGRKYKISKRGENVIVFFE